MVYENIAKIYCELCGKFIKEAVVGSPSKDRQIKVVFNLCEDCKGELYDYNDLAQTYGMLEFSYTNLLLDGLKRID